MAETTRKWQAIETAPAGVVVETKANDAGGERNVQKLKREGRLWWTPDNYMCVYYQPTHWREALDLSTAVEG